MYKENSTCETLHELILCCCFVLNTCYLYIHFVLYVWYKLICLIQLKHLCNFYFLSKNFFSSNNIYQRKKESSGLIDWLWFYVSSRIFPTEASQFINRGLLEVLSVSRRFYLFYFEKWTGIWPTSTSLRKPSYFDSGKRINVATKDGLSFDLCFDSWTSFPEFF